MSNNHAVDSVALIGGFLISLSLLSQIHKVYSTKSAKDLSYVWQAIYLIGLVMHLQYGYYYDLYPIYVPGTFELFMVFVLIYLKYKYDHIGTVVPEQD